MQAGAALSFVVPEAAVMGEAWAGPLIGLSVLAYHHSRLAARGASLAAFDGRCIRAGGVAPPSNTSGILGCRALPARRLARLGATPDLHHGLRGLGCGLALAALLVRETAAPSCVVATLDRRATAPMAGSHRMDGGGGGVCRLLWLAPDAGMGSTRRERHRPRRILAGARRSRVPARARPVAPPADVGAVVDGRSH